MMNLKCHLFAGFLLMLQSCLLPPPVRIESTENAQPEVEANQSQPDSAYYEININCQACLFRLQETDKDEQDTLHTRWFLFNGDSAANIPPICENEIPPSAHNITKRNVDTCVLDINKIFQLPPENQTYTLEALITDRPFSGPQYRSLDKNAQYTTARFTLKFIRTGTTCISQGNICYNTSP